MRVQLAFLALMAACVIGCAHVSHVLPGCGVAVRPFSAQKQAAIAVSLAALGQDDVLWEVEADWQRMRDDLKACH